MNYLIFHTEKEDSKIYKKQIDDNQKKAINKLFDEKKFKLITKKALAIAHGKFIS